ncbi:MAG TPA: hypothetical protein PLY88_03055 [Candidatus Omnitrophota bacterium]|nr:hypothetical protein [Candidatus Omnitrophota bacterium]HRK61510.1 hypothetical protein [Candidatus Omnitrophota bacterium]
MSKIFLRVYQSHPIDEVRRALLILGEVTGNCAQCGEMGLNHRDITACPHCGARFRFIASRRLETHPAERFQFAKRIATERPDLTLVDLGDYQKNDASAKARDLLG